MGNTKPLARVHSVTRKRPSAHKHHALGRMFVLQVAVAAGCDPQCVIKYLQLRDGDTAVRITSMTRARVERGLALCGRSDLVMVIAATKIEATK